jgi:hypothetical protein
MKAHGKRHAKALDLGEDEEMTKEQVGQWIDIGLEIQFEYNGKGYCVSPI